MRLELYSLDIKDIKTASVKLNMLYTHRATCYIYLFPTSGYMLSLLCDVLHFNDVSADLIKEDS